MKKLLLILIALPLLYSSCQKEEESNNSSNNNTNITVQNIVGVWDVNSLVYDGVPIVPALGCISYIINSDNSFTQKDFLPGCQQQDNTEEGFWDLNGSELTLNFDTYDTIIWNINSFNGTTANLNLVEYLGANNAPSSGSATIVKQ